MVLMLLNTASCVQPYCNIMGDVDLFGLIVWNRVEILCNLFDCVYLYGKMCVPIWLSVPYICIRQHRMHCIIYACTITVHFYKLYLVVEEYICQRFLPLYRHIIFHLLILVHVYIQYKIQNLILNVNTIFFA